MSRSHYLILLCAVVVMMTGCRNRCNNPCGNWYSGNTRIAPPQTYSLNIPGGAQNQAYYNPINTNAPAPTPAARTANSQWRALDGAGVQPNNNQAQPTATQNRFVESNNSIGNGQSVLTRTASNTQLPASGRSFNDARDFASTMNDERLDPTQLPVTNATLVRAPAQSFVNQVPPQTFVAQNQQPYYNNPNFVASGATITRNNPNGSSFYNGSPALVRNNGGFQSQPTLQSNTASTANSSVGWRSAEIGSDRRR